MQNQDQIKKVVRRKYSEIDSNDKDTNLLSCYCSASSNLNIYNIMSVDYSQIQSFNPNADPSIRFRLTTQFSNVRKRVIVTNFGSWAGYFLAIIYHQFLNETYKNSGSVISNKSFILKGQLAI